jgi:hypothetical protein
VWLIVVYSPALLCLPALLLAGVVFVLVPGGFIIIVGGLYYLLVGFIGVVGLASRRARGVPRSRSASPATRFVPARTVTRGLALARARITPATPAIAGVRNDRAIGSATNGLLKRDGDGMSQVASADVGRAPDRRDGPPSA